MLDTVGAACACPKHVGDAEYPRDIRKPHVQRDGLGIAGEVISLGACGLIAMGIARFNRYLAGFFCASMLLVTVLADIPLGRHVHVRRTGLSGPQPRRSGRAGPSRSVAILPEPPPHWRLLHIYTKEGKPYWASGVAGCADELAVYQHSVLRLHDDGTVDIPLPHKPPFWKL